jgi:5-methylcytosine-specific restriction endonuclease McrA
MRKLVGLTIAIALATNPRYANGHRRRQLRQRLLATTRNPMCSWCGLPIDTTLDHLDPGAAEVDEIIPVSRGGSPTSRANTQLLHRLCNQQKGAGPATPPAQQPAPKAPRTSRSW